MFLEDALPKSHMMHRSIDIPCLVVAIWDDVINGKLLGNAVIMEKEQRLRETNYSVLRRGKKNNKKEIKISKACVSLDARCSQMQRCAKGCSLSS